MKAPEVKYTTHTFRFPYAHVIFGRTFEMPCSVVFEYADIEDGNFRIKISSLTGTADGTEYDLLYLTEDDESLYASFILACIVGNKQYWNYDNETQDWWE